jgi:hypothetical protein
MLQNCYLRSSFLSFLHRTQKMSFHTKTLVDGHRMFRCIARNFLFNFFDFLNIFKMYFHNRYIYSYKPKHHIHPSPNKFISKQTSTYCLHIHLLGSLEDALLSRQEVIGKKIVKSLIFLLCQLISEDKKVCMQAHA